MVILAMLEAPPAIDCPKELAVFKLKLKTKKQETAAKIDDMVCKAIEKRKNKKMN